VANPIPLAAPVTTATRPSNSSIVPSSNPRAAWGEIESALCEPPPKHRDQSYWLMTLRHGRAIRDAELAWCNETLEHLRRLAAEGKR